MIKFFKPSTRSVLNSLWATWRDKPEPDAAESSDNPRGLEIVHRLRSLKHDKAAWLAELDALHAEGFEPEIVFIDTGLVTHLSDTNRRNFLELFTAVASFDGYRAGQLMVERCRSPQLVIDEETFALKMQKLVLSVKSQTFSLAKIKISDVLSQVLNNVRDHHVKMEADFVNTVISILLLEGIGRQLDPEMDLFKSALPILRQLGKQVGTEQVMSQAGKMDLKSLASMAKVRRAAALFSLSSSLRAAPRLMPAGRSSRRSGSGSRRASSRPSQAATSTTLSATTSASLSLLLVPLDESLADLPYPLSPRSLMPNV